MADEGQRLVGGVLPLDDVDSGDIELVGRFAEFVDRLDAAVSALGAAPDRRTPGPPRSRRPPTPSPRRPTEMPGSAQQLQRLLDDLIGEATIDDAVGRGRPRTGRRRVAPGRPAPGTAHPGQLPNRTPDHLHARAHALGAPPGGVPARPRRRGLPPGESNATATTSSWPTPTSAIAIRGAKTASSSSTPCWPPPSTWSITYTGRDERTNLERPPAVPVGELLDVVDRTVRTEDGDAGSRRDRRPPPPPAFRRPQLHGRRTGRRAGVELRSRQPPRCGGVGGGSPETTSLPARPSPRHRHRRRRARRPRPVPAPPDPGLSPPAARDPAGLPGPTPSTTPSPSTSTPWSVGTWGTGC